MPGIWQQNRFDKLQRGESAFLQGYSFFFPFNNLEGPKPNSPAPPIMRQTKSCPSFLNILHMTTEAGSDDIALKQHAIDPRTKIANASGFLAAAFGVHTRDGMGRIFSSSILWPRQPRV